MVFSKRKIEFIVIMVISIGVAILFILKYSSIHKRNNVLLFPPIWKVGDWFEIQATKHEMQETSYPQVWDDVVANRYTVIRESNYLGYDCYDIQLTASGVIAKKKQPIYSHPPLKVGMIDANGKITYPPFSDDIGVHEIKHGGRFLVRKQDMVVLAMTELDRNNLNRFVRLGNISMLDAPLQNFPVMPIMPVIKEWACYSMVGNNITYQANNLNRQSLTFDQEINSSKLLQYSSIERVEYDNAIVKMVRVENDLCVCRWRAGDMCWGQCWIKTSSRKGIYRASLIRCSQNNKLTYPLPKADDDGTMRE